MLGVAHVDAEDIHTGHEQFLDHLRGGGGRTEGGDDLDFPVAAHAIYCPCALVVFSPDNETVQSACSPVSTSKKPIFW